MKIDQALEFQYLYQRIKNEPLNIKVAYKLNKLYNQIMVEASFYEDSLNKILNKYAQKDELGNFVQNKNNTGVLIEPEFIEICHKEIRELQSIEFDTGNIIFSLDELEDLKLTLSELNCLQDLIVD